MPKRRQVSLAPDFRPGSQAQLTRLKSRLKALDQPGPAREQATLELALARRVAGYTAPSLEPYGQLPFGPGRPGLERVEISDFATDAAGRPKLILRQLRRARGPTVLARLPADLKAVADRYQALSAAIGSPGARDLEAPGGAGQISDGGAVARCAIATELRRAWGLIGGALVLPAAGGECRGRQLPLGRRALLDRVCLDGLSLERVLRAYGWPNKGETFREVSAQLRATLEVLASRW